MITVKVKEIVMDQSNNPLLLLADLEGKKILPLGISFWEAQSIAVKLKGEVTPRPLTHDLIGSIIKEMDVEVDRIEIYDVHQDTFYANIFMHYKGTEIVVDARPSDAVALALTVGASIYLSEKVDHYTISSKDLVIGEDEDTEGGEGGTRLH